MAKKVELRHRTAYRYERPVAMGPQIIQLRPAPHCATPILSYALALEPPDHLLNWQFDPLGNHLARVILPRPAKDFVVDVTLVADMSPLNPFSFFLDPGCETFPFQYADDLARNLEPYRSIAPAGPLFKSLLQEIPRKPQSTVSFVGDMAALVRDRITYRTRLEHGVQTCEQTLHQLTGSCRDSAWLLVQLFRARGLAARFVSGYLIQLAAESPDDTEQAQPKTDTADLHAWTEVFLPGAGWIGVDPTSGLFTAEGHIPLVCTPTASQAAPVSGTVEPANVDFSFSVAVRRIDDTPDFRNPFTEEAWANVRDVAHEVDRRLMEQGVGLTMGGEPTYVGIDEPESGQWNLEALGSIKRTRALALIRCLRERTAPGGLLHFGQGKWYPGEPLPRWAYLCVSRLDGVPIWQNVDLIAREDDAFRSDTEDSLRFLQALSRRLQVSHQNILPAFEPPADDEGTGEPTGYILPLRRRQVNGRLLWSSQLWFDRPARLILFPGDSPIGYRIPADQMPFVAPDEPVYAIDGETGLAALATTVATHPERFAIEPEPDTLPPLSSTAETASELIRPALCAQVVEGRLRVSLPYTSVSADYLDIVAAVEETCQHLGIPIWLEGYPPPFDPRLRFYGLTPDPGVLEVNLPPTANWNDLEELNQILHEEAHSHRLIAGKFAYDGSHLATGGGSHIVLGGRSLAESPVLRRPDLLRSIVTFWQRHPSLSYLFSGMYVGPTSQHPRVDEARVDALYELEVAFSQLIDADCPPHILDGLFRNLLVDVTGNTHRAEFCIDKMFPPEGQGIRLGLLELRAFEMPPHYRMGLVQMLLVRALVGSLWERPCTSELIRWEETLHDRFMLPHFIQNDFKEVLLYLQSSGLRFAEDWFCSHFEWRFPKIGSVTAEGVTLELRQALEPWNVLAEETSSGRTGRSVDSSLERIQLKVTGLPSGSRFIVSCNGRRVPITHTGNDGEAVAGIRYRARMLSAALHPTVPIHTPLTFDLIDTWKSKSIARCAYYSLAPDGTIYTSRPRNAEEARARRLQRFVVSDPPSESIPIPYEEKNLIFPMTLDLRFPPPAKTSGLVPGETMS